MPAASWSSSAVWSCSAAGAAAGAAVPAGLLVFCGMTSPPSGCVKCREPRGRVGCLNRSGDDVGTEVLRRHPWLLTSGVTVQVRPVPLGPGRGDGPERDDYRPVAAVAGKV